MPTDSATDSPPRIAAPSLVESTFNAYDPRLETVLDEVLGRLPEDADWEVLDLGCGTGDAVLALAAARPRARFTGVELSPSSVRIAEGRSEDAGLSARVTFRAGDYTALDLGRYDLVVADGVLHLIPGSTDELFAKLASELRSGGLLVVNMPYRSPYNLLLSTVRRALRGARGRWLDRVGMTVARRLHPDVPDELLTERLIYAYVPPERMGSDRVDAFLEREHGLRPVARRTMSPASPAQLRHHLSVYRRTP